MPNELTIFPILCYLILIGAVAQLGERLNGIQEADGSIPFSSTNENKGLSRGILLDPFLFHRFFTKAFRSL